MPASVTSFTQMVNNSPVGTGTTVGATYLNGITDAINHLERLLWSDSETAPTEADFVHNARYTGSAWTRINSASSTASKIKLDSSRVLTLSHVAAGTGAITWVDAITLALDTGIATGLYLSSVRGVPGTFQRRTTTTNFETTSTSFVTDTQLGTITVTDPGYNYVLEVTATVFMYHNVDGYNSRATFGIDGVSQEANVEITHFWIAASSYNNRASHYTLKGRFNVSGGANRAITLMVKVSNAALTLTTSAGLLDTLEAAIVGRQ